MNNVPLNAMLVFAKVVEYGSFSAAARVLKMTTSAVSRHVTRLEASVGGALLRRTTRAFSLTELGHEAYAVCTRVASAAQEMGRLGSQYSSAPQGLLRINVSVTFGQSWLAPRLPELLRRYPDLDIQVTMLDRMVDLVEEEVDVAIRIAQELPLGLVARHLSDAQYKLVASAEYLARCGTPQHPNELPQFCCIYLGYGAFGDMWKMHQKNEQVEVTIPSRVTINNGASILSMVLAGGGIGLVPWFAAERELNCGALVPVLSDWQITEPYMDKIYALYTPTRHLPLKSRVFIDYLVECFAEA